MNSSFSWVQRIFYVLLLAFLSILSVTGTIALRNVLHLALLLMLLAYCVQHYSSERGRMVALAKTVPVPVAVWCGYLLIFPLFAPDEKDAFANLLGKGMWGESILTWLLAWGSILVLGTNRLKLWTLALVSAVPVFIHMVLLVFAWAGFLQPEFYADPTLETAAHSMLAVLRAPQLIHGAFSTFPMGFRGIEPMHGNLGYPASQAMCLALAVFFSAWKMSDWGMARKAAILIAICFVSVVIAQSRAAAYFGLLIVALAIAGYLLFVRLKFASQNLGRGAVALILGVTVFCLALFTYMVAHNPIWYSMVDKAAIGFQIENPKDLLCNGASPATAELVRQRYADKDKAYVDSLVEGLNGDGARVLLARVGVEELIAMSPWGWNGGRDAFQHRMEELCGHAPVMFYSHAHNAWINLVLAVGWIGAALYAWVLLYFAKSGFGLLRTKRHWPIGMALFLLSSFWALRGMVDAVYQEHYLQMQAFVLLFVFLNIELKEGAHDASSIYI